MGAALPIANAGLPLGQRGQRGAVLLELKRSRLTAKNLAAKLGVSLNAVRHHLRELEAEGLVYYEREHRGVGAPVFVYRLSTTGDALFPRHYEETLTALLDRIAQREGRAAAVALLEEHVAELARRLAAELEGAPPDARLDIVARVRSEQGYMAEASAHAPGTGVLSEHNCALHAVAERFPEVCAAEARLLGEVLRADVERRAHILRGCPSCEYHVRFKES
jgi:DeoR family transcriptional regulator, suf operon transcriptional repressor